MSGTNFEDAAAERAVLAGIAKHNYDAFVDVDDICTPRTFTSETNRIIYESFRKIYEEDAEAVLDAPLVMSAAKQLGYGALFDIPTEIQYLRAVFNMPVELSNVRRFAAIIRKLEVTRLIYEGLGNAQSQLEQLDGTESFGQILGIAENQVFNFSSLVDGDSNHVSLLADGVDAWLDNIETNPGKPVGVSTGYPRFDRAIGGGMRRKTVTLIGARTGIGKTQLADNMGLHVAKVLSLPVLNLDSEMDQEQHWARIIANLTGIEINAIENGNFSKNPKDRKRVRDAAEHLKKIPYYYKSIAGMPFEEVLSHMRRWVYKHVGVDDAGNTKDCLVIYDYLKLMTGSDMRKDMAEHQMLGFQMSSLTNFAIKHQLPILSFVQLNRDGIDDETTAAISQSDRLSWFAASVSLFKEKTKEEMEQDDNPEELQSYGNRKLIVLKARHGERTPGDYINLQMTGRLGRIEEKLLRSEITKRKPKHGFEVSGEDDTEL